MLQLLELWEQGQNFFSVMTLSTASYLLLHTYYVTRSVPDNFRVIDFNLYCCVQGLVIPPSCKKKLFREVKVRH